MFFSRGLWKRGRKLQGEYFNKNKPWYAALDNNGSLIVAGRFGNYIFLYSWEVFDKKKHWVPTSNYSNNKPFMNEFDHPILALLKQQQERSEKFSPEQGFEPWPLQCRCSAPPFKLLGQLGADYYVGWWEDYKPVDEEMMIMQEFFIYFKCGLELMNLIMVFLISTV
mgnify:CR=1 FL=1